MNKIIETVRKTGKGVFLQANGITCFNSLDGSDVAVWLTSQGYEVIGNRDTGKSGQAITACGICVSTNGYTHKV